MDLLADLARKLFRYWEKVNLSSLFYQLERRIPPFLASMERRAGCVVHISLKSWTVFREGTGCSPDLRILDRLRK